MRLLLFTCLLFVTTIVLAVDWTPPQNADPTVILREARSDTLQGDYEVALAKQVWYHENALKLQPSQTGVRLSFALSAWLKLGEAYPPALAKLREIRDETEQKIRDPNRVRVNFDDFQDFVALNRTLRQDERTADAFKWLNETDPEDAKQVFAIAQASLIKQKDFELCGKYIDPEKDTAQIGETYARDLKSANRFGKDYVAYAKKKLLNDGATLVAILVLNDRKPEAESVATKLKSFVTDPAVLAKLEKALEKAMAGTVPTPSR